MEGAIADMNNDEKFVQNFMQALGNTFKYTSRLAEFEYNKMQEANLIRDTDGGKELIDDTGGFLFNIEETENNGRRLQIEDVTSVLNELAEDSAAADQHNNDELPPDDATEGVIKLRNLNKKLIVIKNKQLDLLCDEIGPDERQLRVTSAYLELLVVKIPTTSLTKDISFVQSDPTNIVKIPVDELLRQSLQYNPDAKNVCLQVSYIKTNPVSGYPLKLQE